MVLIGSVIRLQYQATAVRYTLQVVPCGSDIKPQLYSVPLFRGLFLFVRIGIYNISLK